jgi:hypothetical protein
MALLKRGRGGISNQPQIAAPSHYRSKVLRPLDPGASD